MHWQKNDATGSDKSFNLKQIDKLDHSYMETARAEGRATYFSLFSKLLASKATAALGAERAYQIMSVLINNIYIHNLEIFLEPLNINIDIGTTAYQKYPDDLEKFIMYVVTLLRAQQVRGCSDIDLTSTLFYAAYIRGKNGVKQSSLHREQDARCLRLLAATCVGHQYSNINIGILSPTATGDFGMEILKGERPISYRWMLQNFLESLLDNVYKEVKAEKNFDLKKPNFFVMATSRHNPRYNQILRLSKIFACLIDKVVTIFKNVPSLSENTLEMNTALDTIKKYKHLEGIDNAVVIDEMKKVEASNTLYSFYDISELKKYLMTSKSSSTAICTEFNLNPKFYEPRSSSKNAWKHSFIMDVDCKKCENFEKVEKLVYSAAEILMLRLRGELVRSTTKDTPEEIQEACYLINLMNVKEYTTTFASKVEELNREVRSKYNKNIDLRIQYDDATAMSLMGKPEPTHIRVISDIHADVNEDRHYVYDFGNDYVLNCGDIAGSANRAKEWIRCFMPQGLVVVGNHMGYDSVDPSLNASNEKTEWGSRIHPKNTKTAQTTDLMKHFNLANTQVLSNEWIEKYGIIFMGNTLFTDFKLYGEENQAACMIEAAKKMNDFKRCYILDKGKRTKEIKTRPFTVEDHARLFKVCLGYIKNRLNYLRRNRKYYRPIVIMTHHCPLPFCVSEEYKNDPLSAAFASDLRWFIDEYPEIRLWCSGHTHSPYDFLYNETRFVCKPWGYFNENGYDENNYGERIPMMDIKSKIGWRELLKDEIEIGAIKDYGCSEEARALWSDYMKTKYSA